MIALGSISLISSARARVSAARIRQSRAAAYHDDGDVMRDSMAQGVRWRTNSGSFAMFAAIRRAALRG